MTEVALIMVYSSIFRHVSWIISIIHDRLARVDLVRRLVRLVASPSPEVQLQARALVITDDKLDIKTFSLEEVAAMVLPPDMTNGARWLSHRLNRGELIRVSRGSNVAADTR